MIIFLKKKIRHIDISLNLFINRYFFWMITLQIIYIILYISSDYLINIQYKKYKNKDNYNLIKKIFLNFKKKNIIYYNT